MSSPTKSARDQARYANAAVTLEKQLRRSVTALQKYLSAEATIGASPDPVHCRVDGREVLMRDMREYAQFIALRNRVRAAS